MAQTSVRTKTDTMTLPCRLSELEVRQRAKEAAREENEIRAAEKDKKKAMSEYKARIETHQGELARLSEMVRSEVEYRDVQVEIELDYTLGMVRVTRTDTGEVIEPGRPMTRDEKQMRLEV